MDFISDLASELKSIDPIDFVEQNLTIKGKKYELRNCGRDYLHELYRYIVFQATRPTGVPVIVVKGRQVEMSTTATAISQYIMASGMYDHTTGLHAFPLIKTAARYSVKAFDSMVQESVNHYLERKQARTKIVNGKIVTDNNALAAMWNQTQKDFKDQNTLYIEGAGTDGDRLRGMQIDFLLYDEFQDWCRDAVAVTKESLSHSTFGPSGTGLELYFGTPKEAGSEFHEKWLLSDMRYYHLKCLHCGFLQKLTLDNFHEGFMVKCLSCKKVFDKRQGVAHGQWIPLKPENTFRMRGYHIDQLLVPTINREAIDRKLVDNNQRTNANEVFGEFYSGSIDELTIGKVMNWTTTKPDSKHLKFSFSVDGVKTIMGVDWGGRVSGEEDSGQGSYTAVVILSETFEGKYKLEYAELVEQTSADAVVKRIEGLARKYNCVEIFADHGYGADKIEKLREKFGDSVKAVYTAGTNLKRGYAYNEDSQMVTIDKHHALEEMIAFMQQYEFIFPAGDPEQIEWLFEHICGMEIHAVDIAGMIRKRFKKKRQSQPVDGLMALLYAYVGRRFVRTNGFTVAGAQAVRKNAGHHNMCRPQLAGQGLMRKAMGKIHRRQRMY